MSTVYKLNEVLQTVQAILAFDDIYVRPNKNCRYVQDFAGSMLDDTDVLYRVIYQNLYMVKELRDLRNTLRKMVDGPQASAPGPLDTVKFCDKPSLDIPKHWSFLRELSNKARAAEELKRKTNEAPGFTFLDGTELIDQTLRNHIMKRIDGIAKALPDGKEVEFTVVCHPDTAVKLWGKPKGCNWGNYVPTQQGKAVHSVVIVVSDEERMSNKQVYVYVREKGHSEPEPLQFGSFDFKDMMKSSTDARAKAKVKKIAENVANLLLDDVQRRMNSLAARGALVKQLIKEPVEVRKEPKPPLSSGAQDDVRTAIDNLSVMDGCCVITHLSRLSRFEDVPLSSFADKQLVDFKEEISRRVFQPRFFVDVVKTKIYTQAICEIDKLLAERRSDDSTVTMVQTHRPTHTAIRGYPTYAVSPSEPGRIIKVQGFFRTPYSVYDPKEKMVEQAYRHLYRMVAGTCSTISDPMYDDLYELYVRFVLKTEMNRRDTKSNSGLIRVGMFPTGSVLYPTSISRGIKSTDIRQKRWDTLVKIFEELRKA